MSAPATADAVCGAAALRAKIAAMHIATGRLFAMFSFDVGFEIDLRRLRPPRSEPTGDPPNGGRKTAPARVQYPSPSLSLPVGSRALALADRPAVADVTLRAHEFGAVTVLFTFPFDSVECEGLPGLTAALTAGSTLESTARTVLREALPRLAPAIVRPAPDGHGLVEDYYVVQVSRFDPETDAPALLGTHRDLLARIVHCEPQPLSPSETDEVLRTAVTYRPRDLVVTDWNVALVYDEEYEDALDVLELLNVQLLELRFLDTMLDRRIGALYEHVGQPRRLLSFRREVVRVRELSELRLDTATLRERLVNAVKLVGDLYLTKIYARTADRLHLGEWQRSIDGKLELVQKIADVLAGRAATARAELLELTIILLIVFEIVLFFVR
jgi:hypothetical protein